MGERERGKVKSGKSQVQAMQNLGSLYSQSRSTLAAKLAMEDEHRLSSRVAAAAQSRFAGAVAEEELFDLLGGVDINGTFNVAALVLIFKSAVDNLIRRNLIIEPTRY